jgi:hypothetical protein
MSIQAPQGILNIPNAILRVGKLSVDEVVGADTILNTVARNTILLVDDEAYHENKNWALKLPNAWAGEFECNTASAGNYSEFNFYNEGASSNAQGYNLTFNDTAVELRYDGNLLKTGTLASTITGTGVKKVRLMFERTILSVTVDGTLIFTHDDTIGPRPRVYSTTAGGFLNFFTNGGALKNLKIVNEKWMSDGTSNIAYVGGGEVAIGQSLNLQQVSNTSTIKANSNVVTEFTRSKKLIKYPRVALTGPSAPTGYVASASNESSGNSAWEAFDNEADEATTDHRWRTEDDRYTNNSSTGAPSSPTGAAASTYLFSGSEAGDWISVEFPEKMKLNYYTITGVHYHTPYEGVIYGYNTTTTTWERVSSFINRTVHDGTNNPVYSPEFQVDEGNTNYYSKYAMIVVKTNGHHAPSMYEWKLYGVPEYDPEADGVDVVVKSVPNVPNTDWLEVYYDAKDLADGAVTTVNDLKPVGTANNGTAFGDPQVSNGAFVFDGSGDYIRGQLTSFGGEQTFTFSLWFNMVEMVSGSNNSIFQIGSQGSSEEGLGFRVQTGSVFRMYTWGGPSNFNVGTVLPNTWYHAVGTYSGGAMTLYVDGNILQSTSGSSLNLPANPYFALGVQITSSGTEYLTSGFNGSIANFRLFNRVLTSDEIYQLYAYQKEYFGHGDLSMTLKAGRLGIGTSEPQAMLDVRGALDVRGESYFNNVGVTGRTTTRRLNEINFPIPPISNTNQQQFFWLAQFNELQWSYSEYLRFEYNLHYSRHLAQHNRGVTSGGYAIIAARSQGATGTGTQYDNEAPLVRRVEYAAYRGFVEGPHFYYVRNRTRSKGYLVMGFRSSRTWTPAHDARVTGTIQYNGNLDNIDTFNGNVYKHGSAVTTGGVNSHTTLFPSVIGDSKFVAQSDDTVTLHQASESSTYFTGQHTTYIEDLPDLTNHENNNGLIVSSNKNDYIHLTNHKIRGKEAITQDESLPITSLSTRQNDKTCFGVMSCKPFDEYSEKRFCVVNSLGEGAIWVINTNGNLEAGDYITTSNVTGYGQKQDDDILRNYTVAKITMDCNFNPVSRPIKEILRSENGEYILDEDDQIQWTNTNETEMQYNIRYVDANGTIISQDEYTTKLSEGENVYIAAYVGCTYHCG